MKPNESWQEPYKAVALGRGRCGPSVADAAIRACRKPPAMSSRRGDPVNILLNRASVVTEPNRLAYLNAEAAKNNAKRKRMTCRKCAVVSAINQ